MAKGDDTLKDILALCDILRDTELVPLGVALDDQPGPSALFYLPGSASDLTSILIFCYRWQSPRETCISR